MDEQPKEPASTWQPNAVAMSDVEAKPIEWLWEGYIPTDMLTILEGDPGLGKTQITCDLAARVTRQLAMPHTHNQEGLVKNRVLIINGEDDPSRVLRQRLEAAEADLERVLFLRSMNRGDDERPMSLPRDLPQLAELISMEQIGLVILDPMVGFVDDDVNINGDAEVRRLLSKLAKMAEDLGVTVLLVRHLNKKMGISAKYRGGGSIGITAAGRAVLSVGIDPHDASGCVLASVKFNLGPKPRSIKFRIESVGDSSRVSWGEQCDISAEELVQPRQPAVASKLERAKEILAEVLAAGPSPETEVMELLADADISKSTAKRARKDLGVLSHKSAFDGGWELSLPTDGSQPQRQEVQASASGPSRPES